MLVAMAGFGRQEFLQIGQRIGGGEFVRGFADGLDGSVAIGHLVNEARAGGDEAVSADLFPADDAFQQECVLLAAEDLEAPDRGKAAGKKKAIDGDDPGGLAEAENSSKVGK